MKRIATTTHALHGLRNAALILSIKATSVHVGSVMHSLGIAFEGGCAGTSACVERQSKFRGDG